MEEIWKDIPGYEGSYQVSNLGRIKSVGRYCYNPGSTRNKAFYYWVHERILKPYVGNTGYSFVVLSIAHKFKRMDIHVAVALAFIGKRPDGFAIDHIDCNKLNNVVNNLEYVTIRENNRRAIENGCVKIGVGNPHCSIKSKEIESEIIRLRYEERWNYGEIADKFGISKAAVYRCILRCNAYKNIGKICRPRKHKNAS